MEKTALSTNTVQATLQGVMKRKSETQTGNGEG